MFSGRVLGEDGKSLFPPSGQCYVHWKTIQIGGGNGISKDHGLGVYKGRDPVPLVFVRASTFYGGWNGVARLSDGWCTLKSLSEYIIQTNSVSAYAWIFMPGDWVNIKQNNNYKFGIRFYGEDGRVTYLGNNRPLQIATSFRYPKNDPIADITIGSSDLACLIGISGYHITWQMNQSVDYLVSRILHNGKLRSFCYEIGSELYVQSASDLPIPCINTSVYP